MQNRTYAQLYSLIEGLFGVEELTNTEQADVLAFVNRRAAQAYNKPGAYWIRNTVVGEKRSIGANPPQVIPFSEGGLSDVGEFIRIHRDQPWLNQSSPEYSFFTDTSGAHLIGITDTSATSAYVTYKKTFDDFNENSTDIPFEWFNFIAHAVFSDLLRKDGQHGRAAQEEMFALDLLNEEMTKPTNVINLNILTPRVHTYINRSYR